MSEPMKSSMFTSSNLLIKFVAAAALVSGVAYTVYVSISDGNISSDEINTIFDQALQKDPEPVTTLCKENLNESGAVQAFIENNSDSNITVNNDVLDTVKNRCNELLATTPSSSLGATSTSSSTTVSSNETTSDEVIDFDELFYEEYFNVKWYWDVIYWDIATDELVTPYYQEILYFSNPLLPIHILFVLI